MIRVITKVYSWWLLTLGPIVFVYALGPWIDSTYFPVVDPFVVVSSENSNGQLVIRGWMDKKRPRCKTREVYAILQDTQGLPNVADINFKETATSKAVVTRPGGVQSWGPWTIPVNPTTNAVLIRTRHSCQPLWDTISEFPVYEKQP